MDAAPDTLDKRASASKVRVGYFSPDLSDHPIMYILADVFEQHDRQQFEWYAFYSGRGATGEMHRRARAALPHFFDVSAWTDDQIVAKAREIGIDVAVDLAGHTANNRLSALARRCAPAQVTYIGYPGTTAVPTMDYIFGSPVVTPDGCADWFTERVVRLPHLVPVTPRGISDKPLARAAVGLPDQAVVFCSFNNTYKFTPEVFDVWVRIVQAVEGAVLWLYAKTPEVEANLRKEAAARGLSGDRLVFGGTLPTPEHMARLQLADLFLDTHPYNAHTTALDAVWVGLPVLTFVGHSYVSRMAAGVLDSLGLNALVAADLADYEAKAIALGRDKAALTALRHRLLDPAARQAQPYDAQHFARLLETAYRTMSERARSGVAPAPFDVMQPGVVRFT